MAHDTTILSGDIGVWWFPNNRAKLLHWIGGTETNYTMNEIYSAMATLLDESTTIDDGTCFSAETPVEYTIGKIDAGDSEPWYISFDLMEHITGGALRTSGWTRVQDSNTGIVCVQVDSGGAIVASDRGYDIVHSDGDSGTLLEFIDTGGAVDYCIIRPDSSAIANSFDAASSDTLTCNGHAADVLETDGVATTGEMIWANIYSIGTIDSNVHMYVYQGERLTTDASERRFSWNSATLDWYGNGHIDIVCPINDITTASWPVIDDGYLRVFARKGGDLFASFEVSNSTTSGGRNPVPMQTSLDLDAGYSGDSGRGHGTSKVSFTGAVGSGPFINGEVITQAGSLARGILDLTNSTVTSGGELVYWPIATAANGGALTAFDNTNVITGATSGATVTSDGVPAADGPADSGWFTGSEPTITFTSTTTDIDNDGNDEEYGIEIDCKSSPLTEVYQWMKWICSYGEGDTDTIEAAEDLVYGEEYEGGTTYISYTGGTTPTNIVEGESVTQQTTGATGVVISHNTSTKVVLLRSTRGAFESGYTIDADDDSSTWTTVTAANFAAKTAAPLGTFAGGTMFFARGVVPVISGVLPGDENSYICTDIGGTSNERPTSITIEVTPLEGTDETTSTDDNVAIWKLTGSGGNIEKDSGDAMVCDGGEAIGDTTLAVDAIPVWAPTTGGTIILVDISDSNKEYAIRYTSYDSATDVYTLSNIDIASVDSGSTTTVVESGAFGDAKRGDLVYDHDQSEVSYVKTVDSANQITVYPAFSATTAGHHVELNCIPIVTTASDEVFNAIMHRYAVNTTESVGLIYPGSTMYFRVKVRNTRSAVKKIKPYSSDGSTSGTDQSIPVVRTEDTIIS